ncbi:hypothetical protein UFOVP325_32 [uncultured Caudovirales phage]|uniref:Uncharacterized protein n=1 Tax=uncultured Caudovirales phage TaxID=2100421 RepID=A0A6J5LW55_9CAUD|nr:hypothetical protein UFOVP325_32 [uncultured Caudovirales phage]CAB4147433.1 hypothetical protein UFOVP430_27 [uncultured Caudovirales phage]
MELTIEEAKKIQGIYSMYHMGTMGADEALWELEQVINNQDDEELGN